MKLKRFESFKSADDKLYHKIEVDQWNNDLSNENNWEPFTDLEFSKINSLLPGAIYFHWIRPTKLSLSRLDWGNGSDQALTIIKMSDEWIYVSVDVIGSDIDGYYKCDTLDGLIQLIWDFNLKI